MPQAVSSFVAEQVSGEQVDADLYKRAISPFRIVMSNMEPDYKNYKGAV